MFKSDSARVAFLLCVGFWWLRWYAEASVLRASHLNKALVANEKNAAKTEYLGLMSVCFWLGFAIQILVFQVCANQALVV